MPAPRSTSAGWGSVSGRSPDNGLSPLTRPGSLRLSVQTGVLVVSYDGFSLGSGWDMLINLLLDLLYEIERVNMECDSLGGGY